MKLDRLIGILTILLQTEKTTAPELAKRFEVSRRTILRDIDALSMAGIPIVTARGEGGGIAVMEGYKIRHNVLTAEEMQSLVGALKGLDSVSGRSRTEALMAKLAPGSTMVSLADSIVIDLSGHHQKSLSEKIEILRRAIAERRAVRFTYYAPRGADVREVEPYFIQFGWGDWYVFGWCRLRGDFRRFKLERLWQLEMTDDGFEVRPIPPEQASISNAFPDNFQVTLLFDKSARFQVVESYGPESYRETEKGLVLTIDYTNRWYILSWILGFGNKVEIVEPLDLRAELAQLAKKIAERNR